jgi:hypothetical protein
VRKLFVLVLVPLLLTACGGGGGSGSVGSGGGGGGGGGGGTQTIATPGPPNVETLTVNTGPAALLAANMPQVNTAFVSVNVCIPGGAVGTASCQLIPYIAIDTGSIGLRIISSVLTLPLGTGGLPPDADNGNPLAECLTYADGTTTWGPLYVADVQLPVSGERAASVNVQVMDSNATAATVPSSCLGTTTLTNTVVTFGANGILGVGPLTNDCNPVGSCSFFPQTQSANYYTCSAAGCTCPPATCTGFAATLSEQLQNPVSLLPTDNNGTIIELPAVGAAGAASATGSLVFGIGTESNNGFGTATQLFADGAAGLGFVTITLDGAQYPDSYLDSGSNANYFSSTILPCSSTSLVAGFYCPSAITPVDTTVTDSMGTSVAADFNVASAMPLTNTNPILGAFPDLGAPPLPPPAGFPAMSTVDLGLPFFFGRNVYTGIDDTAPYFAF